MFNDRFTPTDARTDSGRTAEKKLRADGGSPIARVFELTDANRISDLIWAEDDNGQLYALEIEQQSRASIHGQRAEGISTAVAIDIQDGIVREVAIDELAVEKLSRVDDVLSGAQRLD